MFYVFMENNNSDCYTKMTNLLFKKKNEIKKNMVIVLILSFSMAKVI